MRSALRRSFVVLSFFAAPIGGVIFDAHRLVAIFLITVGLLGSLYVLFISETSQSRADRFSDATAKLLSLSGAGNSYIEMMDDELSRTGKHDHALEVLDKAIELNSTDIDSLARYVVISALHISLDNQVVPGSVSPRMAAFAKTSNRIERGLATGERAYDFTVAKGILLDEIGLHAEARDWFARVAELQPSSFPFWRLLNATSFGKERLYSRAISELEQACDEGAAGPSFDFQYARALVSMGDYDLAIKLLNRVRACRGNYYQLVDQLRSAHFFAWNPLRSAYFAILCSICIYRKSKRQSLRHLRDASISLSVPVFVMFSRAAQKLARIAPTFRNSKLANLGDPGNPYISLGISLIQSGRYFAAQKQFLKASKNSKRLNTWLNLCSASVVMGDWQRARTAYEYLAQHWPEEIPEGYSQAIQAGLAGDTITCSVEITEQWVPTGPA